MSAQIHELLTPRQLSKRLGRSLPTIYRWIAEGKGPAHIRLGHAVYYEPEEVERFEREWHPSDRRVP